MGFEAKLPGSAADVPKSYVQSLGWKYQELKVEGLKLQVGGYMSSVYWNGEQVEAWLQWGG